MVLRKCKSSDMNFSSFKTASSSSEPFATRVNTSGNYSALNMYQGGRVRLRSHTYQEFYVENSLKRT